MPEPFKNLFNASLILGMGDQFLKAWPDFDRDGFVFMAANNLDDLEFKQRSDQITDAMAVFLPNEFESAAAILLASLVAEELGSVGSSVDNSQGIVGFAVMPMTYYVGQFGIDHFDLSMMLLKEMTKRFSSEFGIRFFLLDRPDSTLSVLEKWVHDPNYHVRRLVSEGTRPRLPWAMRLPAFIGDPAPLVPLLTALRDDKEEYVRRSVANNLNDIAKDHPEIVVNISANWLRNASKDRARLIRHGCRTLIKQGHEGALAALGYHPPLVRVRSLETMTPVVPFGDALVFELEFRSTSVRSQPLIVDYAIDHRKANGGTKQKVFKWRVTTLEPLGKFTAIRRHVIRKISTRTYYPGAHGLEVLINGVSFGRVEFELTM